MWSMYRVSCSENNKNKDPAGFLEMNMCFDTLGGPYGCFVVFTSRCKENIYWQQKNKVVLVYPNVAG